MEIPNENYDYKILAEYIQFGFPLAIDYAKFCYNDNISNHFSAMCREKGVDKYFKVETSKNAILGPIVCFMQHFMYHHYSS